MAYVLSWLEGEGMVRMWNAVRSPEHPGERGEAQAPNTLGKARLGRGFSTFSLVLVLASSPGFNLSCARNCVIFDIHRQDGRVLEIDSRCCALNARIQADSTPAKILVQIL